jgi:hypothetical protein
MVFGDIMPFILRNVSDESAVSIFRVEETTLKTAATGP